MRQDLGLDEIASAVWLDPTDPSIRDLRAQMPVRAGKQSEGLEQVRESVFNSPSLGTHFYLRPPTVEWLAPSEQKAIEQGFNAAIAARYPDAVDGLGSFYETFGRYADESKVYTDAAARSQVRSERARFLIAAAQAELKEGKAQLAEAALLQAIEAAPANADSYVELVTGIYGPQKKLSAATSITREGLNNGAEPVCLYVALSSAAEMAGDDNTAQKSLLRALRYDPSFQTVMLVGQFYLQRGHLDRAASMLQNATEIRPSSAEAFYLLGVAQERSYQYSDADKAYARAAILAPQQYRSGVLPELRDAKPRFHYLSWNGRDRGSW